MSKGDYVPLLLDPDFDGAEPSEISSSNTSNNPNEAQKTSIFSLSLCRQYFDVDTHQVLQRLVRSLVPFPNDRSLFNALQPCPDMYGPFWVTATLIFSIALTGSIRDYFTSDKFSTASTVNFTRVTISSSILFVYWLLIPFVLASAVWFRRPKREVHSLSDGEEIKLGGIASELVAVYGYSLTIFIPCWFLLLIPNSIVQWIIMAIASIISSLVLTNAARSIFRKQSKKVNAVLLVSILIIQVLLVAGLSFLFFYHPNLSDSSQSTKILTIKLNESLKPVVTQLPKVLPVISALKN